MDRNLKKMGVFVLLLLLALGGGTLYGQEKKSKKQRKIEQTENVKQLIDAQNYIFIAERALPQSGSSRYLTTSYDVTVTKDEVKAFLPYFGRVYSVVDPTEGGIKFNSTNFDYKVENAKKGGWDIYIKTKDQRRTYDLILKVTSSGSASLSVNDPTRQSITFRGRIEEIK
ncbi:MAG: DUF4251 domain-containing protein [Bacteroidales bacterium]|jgi:hypothetical protein|nr:DUF4251 domain-containing protein [Bacteroidales bacterium]